MSRRAAYLSSIVVAGLISATTPARLNAETIDKLTYMTFSGSVQVPGVKLDAGTYRFRLANPETSRNVMQVLSRDGSTVYAMFHTTPDSRMNVTSESTVTFRETPAGVPPVVKSLFYEGEHRGYEFVYPKGGFSLIAEFRPQPAVTYVPMTASVETTSSSVETASATTAEASAEPAAALETRAPEPVASAAAPAVAEAEAPVPEELPRTASGVPLVALSGFTSLLVGLGAGVMRRLLV